MDSSSDDSYCVRTYDLKISFFLENSLQVTTANPPVSFLRISVCVYTYLDVYTNVHFYSAMWYYRTHFPPPASPSF